MTLSSKFVFSTAFSGCCGLTSVIIPNSVTTIGEWAFAWCSSLKDILAGWAIHPVIPGDVFTDVAVASCTLHVPAGTESLYQSAPVWKEFHIVGGGAGASTSSGRRTGEEDCRSKPVISPVRRSVYSLRRLEIENLPVFRVFSFYLKCSSI
jgi:hypothetical protein